MMVRTASTLTAERTAVYLPRGTKARIRQATENFMNESTFVRIAIFEKLKTYEQERRANVVSQQAVGS